MINPNAPDAGRIIVTVEHIDRPGNCWFYRAGIVCLQVDFDANSEGYSEEWPAMFWVSNPGYLTLTTAKQMHAVLTKALEEIREWRFGE